MFGTFETAGDLLLGADAPRNLDRNDRRDMFVGLKLEQEVDAFLHQEVGILESDFRAILAVDRDQTDMFALGDPMYALTDIAREL